MYVWRTILYLVVNFLAFRKSFFFAFILNVVGLTYYAYFRYFFTRLVSRRFGNLFAIKIPTFLRKLIFNGYCWLFNVNKEEILDKNFTNYRTVNEFFIRKIDVKIYLLR